VDDDEYLEYEVPWDDEPEAVTHAVPVVQADDSVTEPMWSRAEHLMHAPAEAWHSDPIESWRHFPRDDGPDEPVPARDPEPQSDSRRGNLDELFTDGPPLRPKSDPIGFAHNGFHVDNERFQPLPPPGPQETRPSRHERPSRHQLTENQPEKGFWFASGRHSRDDDPDDAPRYGRHSLPGRD